MKTSCPICGSWMPGPGPKEWPDWPFCSKRCKTIDLGRWLDGIYHIATPMLAEPDTDLEESANPAAPSAVPHKEAH